MKTNDDEVHDCSWSSAQPTLLHRILQHSGYSVSLAGAELIWFEKSLADGGHPLECA
jgi:hypothetical protein